MKGSSVKERLARRAMDLKGQLVSVYYAFRDPRVKALPKIIIPALIALAV